MADSLNIKNPSIRQGDLDLRTDEQGYITSISGHPIAGGGGGGGTTYYGDNEYIQIKNGTVNTFTVTDNVKDVVDHITEKIALQVDAQTYNKNDIDTKLSAKQDELVFEGYDDKIETINGSGFIVNGYVSTNTYQIDKNNFNKQIDYLSASVSGKEDKLTFEYDEDNKVSAINGSALAGQGGTTYTPGQYINIDSNNEISVTGVVAADEYATYSGDWNDVSNSYKTNSGSFLTSEALTQYSTIEHANDASANAFNQATARIPTDYITKDVNDLTNYYKKTQTSSDIELAEAFGSILKYDVTAAAGIQVTTATDAGVKTYGITMTAQPVVTDTRLSGYNGIAAEPDGNVSGLWDVGLTQDMLNKINGKLDSTVAAQTYLEKTTYSNASGKWENASNVVATNSASWNAKVDQSDLNNYLTKAQYGTDSATFALKNQLDEYATLVQLENASGKLLTTAQYQTDSATFALKTQLDDYYKKTDTSSKTELSTEFAKYVTTSLLDTVSSTLNDDIKYVSGQVDNKVDKPSTSLKNNYLVLRTDSNGDVSGWCDLQDQSYSKSESQGTFVHRGMLDNSTGGTLTGTGLTGGTVLGVNTDVIQTKLTDEQISAIGEVSSKLDRADLDDYVPYSATKLAIGSNNDISESNSNNSFAQGTNNKVSTSPDSFVQGEANSAVNYYSLAQGYGNYAQAHALAQGTNNHANTVSLTQGQNNSATTYSFAQGTENSAVTTSFAQGSANKARYDSFAQGNRNSAFSQSFAQGHYNSADDGSLAQGKHNTAYSHSLAQGSMNYADNHAMAQGGDNTAKYFSQALGFGLSIQGSRGTTDGTDYISGGLAIGTYNETSAGVAFVVGNGHSNGSEDPTRSDAFVIYPDGRVSAAGKISANGVELGAGGGALTLPLNIGNNNTVTSDSIGVIGNNSQAGTKSIVMSYQGATAISNSMSVGDGNYASGNAAAFGWGSTAKDYSFSVGNGVSSTNHSYIFGHGTSTAYSTSNNYSIAVGDSVVADNYSQVFGRGLTFTGNTGNTFGGLAIGGWNKTSGNAIFVVGNGSYSTGTSDAFIIRPNGNTEIYGSLTVDVSSGKNVLAVASAATLIGASRQTSEHYGVDNTALGTTWLGVGSNGMHQGFIKYTDGGDVGALDSNSTIQINIKPENAGLNGEMTITNVNGSTTSQSKVVNVPTASYNNMSSFDNTNGPNYMLRKTASGFDIGAAVINVTSLPQQTEANAYYFVYDI